ncbi:aldo/keto reductase [Paenibacillus filicis]|uniref:Aldo/keto reductase n=1 Tax=Paenibacillus gyeongsangnamensis TaxID=3388067 RepID=A0ABT4QC14_9BACL|nr:aldo/keto reductase [Paenibacillus filicis]MCZ8514396.1 aldo/keto reductase [Paenibacillus filicis]
MKYRMLGKTKLKVSIVGVGTWQFGGAWGKDFTQDEVNAILDKAADLGINLLDTAECYGHHLSESFIGNYMESRRNRTNWIVATKFGHNHLDKKNPSKNYWSAEEVQNQLEESLKALKTDYVDLYQFHSGPNEVFDNDDLWTMLDKQVQAGKVRNLAISINKDGKDNLHQTDSASNINAKAIQVVYNRLDQRAESEVFPSCQRQDLGVLARVPLASGYLSGKYRPDAVFPENDVRSRHDKEETALKLKQVEEILRNEVPQGASMAEWALAWCFKHPAVTCVIPGSKSPEQIEINAKAASFDFINDSHPQAWK